MTMLETDFTIRPLFWRGTNLFPETEIVSPNGSGRLATQVYLSRLR